MTDHGIQLSTRDEALLHGAEGSATRMAMSILVTMAGVYGAKRLLDVEMAHIDGCLYHGISGLEFAERLVAGGARVRIPTTLNVGAVDLVHRDNFQGVPEEEERGRRLMECYESMGCNAIWTCAPYQQMPRPSLGQQIAWAESNAIVFANSVLGARTNRYGDFIDICAAITGRAPAVGLHLDEPRLGQVVFYLDDVPDRLLEEDAFYPVLGYLVGSKVGNRIPVIVGLPSETSEDQLKAFGAAAASAGAVALFHAVGRTPEAPTLAAALGGRTPHKEIHPTVDQLRNTLDLLSTSPDGPIDVVALGSPHFSLGEFEQLVPLLDAFPPSPQVELIVCTSRLVLWQLEKRKWRKALEEMGVRLVVDTCVVVTPIIHKSGGVLMTNSGKFAHYTPGNIGFGVVFGSLQECIRSASRGRVWRDPELWDRL